MKDASTNAVRYGHVDYPSLGTVSVHDAIDRRGISLLAIPCVETMFPNNISSPGPAVAPCERVFPFQII